MSKRSGGKQPNLNQIAVQIDKAATQTAKEESSQKNPASVALNRLGGKKGGPVRAEKLPPKKVRETAQKAANARWAKKISTPRTFK